MSFIQMQSNNQPIQVPKIARSQSYSRDLIYYQGGKKLHVTLSDRQLNILNYAWKKLRLYYVNERYSYTERAKLFVLEGSNKDLRPGEVELTFHMLKVYFTLSCTGAKILILGMA